MHLSRLFSVNMATILCLSFCLSSCNQEVAEKPAQPKVEEGTKARAQLKPTQGNNVTGEVVFIEVEDGIKVVADIKGLTPGLHGFHVHESGDCSAPDGSSAGAHFDPLKSRHGGPDSGERHVGDLGNVVAGDDGTAHYERVDKIISFSGTNSIIGRSVIIHADPDDFKTQPTGNSGGRIGCGVIELED